MILHDFSEGTFERVLADFFAALGVDVRKQVFAPIVDGCGDQVHSDICVVVMVVLRANTRSGSREGGENFCGGGVRRETSCKTENRRANSGEKIES